MKTIQMLLKVITGLSVCFSQTKLCGETKETENEKNTRIEIFKSVYERMKPVSISGKVVDAEENAIAGAEICVSWEKPIYLTRGKEDARREWVKSDTNGFWKITVGKADTAYIMSAQKVGYQYLPGSEAGKNFSEVKMEDEAFVKIRLRKIGETTFLIKREQAQIIRAISPNSQASDIDLFKERRSEPIQYVDFGLVADYIPISNAWAMTFFATNGMDGIIFSDARLYMAPTDGYRPKITLRGPPWPKFMYLRSRSPSIYSCLQMDYVEVRSTQTNNTACVHYKAWINPYGERNLEYDNSLEASWRVVDELKAEAKQAIHAKKLPPKPDIPQRIKATSERVAHEKKESDKRHKEWMEQQKKQKERKAE